MKDAKDIFYMSDAQRDNVRNNAENIVDTYFEIRQGQLPSLLPNNWLALTTAEMHTHSILETAKFLGVKADTVRDLLYYATDVND